MNDNPVALIFMSGIGLYMAWLWWCDLKMQQSTGLVDARGLPGAFPASARSLWIAALGTLVILAGETMGEIALGISAEQSDMTVMFGMYTLVAAIIEELIFRGYVVVTDRGKKAFFAGIFLASLLFALMHPFLWEWEDDGFVLTLDLKGWFSTAVVFIGSLWFYACRFAPWNPRHSLLPCFVAHLTKNAGVFIIKGYQGHVVGLW